MPKRPLIGISPYVIIAPHNGRPMTATYRSYIDAIESAGGEPIILSPDLKTISRYTKLLDGLLLIGGDDIHPKFYREKLRTKKSIFCHEDRTRFELSLVRAFLKSGKPFFGICLGTQTMNVALGGSLIQDIPTERPAADNHRKGFHNVFLLPGSRLSRILGAFKVKVNTSHHQAIHHLAHPLHVTAFAPDGIVEAVEVPKHPFALGVQWHPELTPKDPSSRKLFKAFVSAAKHRP